MQNFDEIFDDAYMKMVLYQLKDTAQRQMSNSEFKGNKVEVNLTFTIHLKKQDDSVEPQNEVALRAEGRPPHKVPLPEPAPVCCVCTRYPNGVIVCKGPCCIEIMT